MNPTTFALLLLLQGCTSQAIGSIENALAIDDDGAHKATVVRDAELVRPGANVVQAMGWSENCLRALAPAKDVEGADFISAFRIFNEYPPVANKKQPGGVDIGSVTADTPDALDCLEDISTFSFVAINDGLLSDGGGASLYPLTAWRVSEGYIVFYIHKTYETADGEGESVDISALAVDRNGKPHKPLQSVASWYEYEGSIRIRDFQYESGKYITTEELVDPSMVDHQGNVMKYGAGSGKRSITAYDLDEAMRWPRKLPPSIDTP